MRLISKLATAATALSVVAVAALSMSPVFADSPGQLEGGTISYQVRNVTQNGNYSSQISANACDEVKYSIRLHNTAFGGFSNVHVGATLPSNSGTSNTSTMTATTNLGGTTGTSSSVTVNTTSAQTITYENGSTVLYDGNGNAIKTLPDGITGSGVDIGGLNGSTTEFVNFQAKVNCPTPPSHNNFTSTQTASATASATANASVNCPKGSDQSTVNASATASASASATASATSTVSQADADAQALAAAQAQAHTNAQAQAQANAQASANSAANAKCTTTPPPTVTTTTPTALPNTGPGDAAELFVGTSTVGAAGHFLFRRFRR